MASPTQWTWVWVSSGSWWRTGKPDMLQSMGFQRVGHDWVTEQQQQMRGPVLIWLMLLGFNALTCEAHVESSQVRSISSFISSIMRILGESRLPRLLITNYLGANSKSFCLAPSINLRPGSLRKGNQESGWLGLRQDTLVEIVVGCVGVCVREREKEKEKERERHYMSPK